jgi:hypothetical protein
MSFTERESFKHKLAKELLCQWLKENEKFRWGGDGVHVEYPLIPAMRHEHFGNVIGYGYYAGNMDMDYYQRITNKFNPSYSQCVGNNDIPIAVLDIAVVYKGCVQEGFEIYHTHRVDEKKKREL